MGEEYHCEGYAAAANDSYAAYTEIFEDQAIIFDFMSVTYRLFWLLFGFSVSSSVSSGSSGNQLD